MHRERRHVRDEIVETAETVKVFMRNEIAQAVETGRITTGNVLVQTVLLVVI